MPLAYTALEDEQRRWMRSQLSKQVAKSGHKPGATPGAIGLHPASDIPDKLYFKIGEVAKLCAIQTYVLRFWESEFPQLRPTKSGTGQRLYRKRDVEMALKIRRLLYEEGYTIPGARLAFQQESRNRQQHEPEAQLELKGVAQTAAPIKVTKLKAELREILGMLSGPPKRPRLVERDRGRRSPIPSTPQLFND
jgi:DNA-binding transcriptional MerR regulator